MPISGGEKTVPALPKTKVSLHYGGSYCTSGQEHPQEWQPGCPQASPASQLAKGPVSHWASVNPMQPGWEGSEGHRLLHSKYFLPLRSTLCWKLCFCEQSWDLFLFCLLMLWGGAAGHLGFFTTVWLLSWEGRALLSWEGRALLYSVLYKHTEVIPALRNF